MITQIIPFKRKLLIEKVGYYDKDLFDYYKYSNSVTDYYNYDLIEIECESTKLIFGRDIKIIGESSSSFSVEYNDYDNYDGHTYSIEFSLDYVTDEFLHSIKTARVAFFYKYIFNKYDNSVKIECIKRNILKNSFEQKNDYHEIHSSIGRFSEKVMLRSTFYFSIVMSEDI